MNQITSYKGDRTTPFYSGGRNDQGDIDETLQPTMTSQTSPIGNDRVYQGEIINEREFVPYFPSEDLIQAVNIAIRLGRPLLIEGEPGCGKTRLADAIAYEFTQKYIDKPEQFWPYHVWNVKSVGRARDGLYTFDAILRLRDAQLMGSNFAQLQRIDRMESANMIRRLKNKAEYLTYGPFGKALLEDPTFRSILLIDEIDKADSDFPNDLLSELDQKAFDVPEASLKCERAPLDPIIIITSNRERPLPEAFLRRCIYFYLGFPTQELLAQIISQRFGDRLSPESEVVKAAIAKFEKMYDVLKIRPGSKPPGTSELLEFLEALVVLPESKALETVKDVAKRSPYLGILLKTRSDQEIFQKVEGSQG